MGGAGYQAGHALTTPCRTLDEVREASRQIIRANEANPDPNTSAIAASATVLALLARERDQVVAPSREVGKTAEDRIPARRHIAEPAMRQQPLDARVELAQLLKRVV